MLEQISSAALRTARSRVDWPLVGAIAALVLLGLVNLHSATAATQQRLFTNQLYWLGAGVVVYAVTAFIDYRFFYRLAYPLYAAGLTALVLVLAFGRRINGSRRWFALGPVRVQPSELMKVILIVVIAKLLHDLASPRPASSPLGRRFQPLAHPELKLILAIVAPVLLVMKQPDLGTGLIIALCGFFVLFVARYRLRTLLFAGLGGLLFVPVAWFGLLRPYQKERILTFLDPSRDPGGAGYHSRQAIFAVGSGQLTGKGYLRGTQNQLQFLPEHWTDFPFAVWAEEWGFVGCLVLLALYLFVIVWAVGVAASARDRFGALCALGVAGLFLFHVVLNIGMVAGLVPVVGVTLPLVSYGGSSLLTMMLALGLLTSVSVHRY